MLLLCFFVEDKSNNQFVIQRIMQLPLDVQTELMSLIESGLGKVNSEPLLPVKCNSEVMSLETNGSRTPSRPSKYRSRSNLHQGLDSPAGRRWLASPAISARKRRAPKTPLIASIVRKTDHKVCVCVIPSISSTSEIRLHKISFSFAG